MLVEHQAVKPDLLTIFVFIEIRIVELSAQLGVKMAVGKGQADSTIGTVFDVFGSIVDVGAFGKSHQKHWASPLAPEHMHHAAPAVCNTPAKLGAAHGSLALPTPTSMAGIMSPTQ